MIYLLSVPLLLAVIYGPSWWVKWVMRRHARPADRYPASGAELARRLLDEHDLADVGVECTDQGDHYDPRDRAVRLLPDHHDGRSLTAVTIAAHEVGHALQHARGYRPLILRMRLVEWMQRWRKLGMLLLVLAPVLMLVLRLPRAGLILLALGVAAMGSGILVHLVTLPTELDASFRRALPLLDRGGYLYAADRPHARRILTAAALTYVAGSLMSLFNFWAWLRWLRF